MAGRFRARAGDSVSPRYPSLNPSPRGRDSAAEAAVRLQAKSLHPEGASIQGMCSAEAVFFVLLYNRIGTELLATLYESVIYKTPSSKPSVCSKGLEPRLFYNTDNHKDTERPVPTLVNRFQD